MKKTKFLLLALLGCLLVAPVFAAQAKVFLLENENEGFYTYDAAQNNNIVLTSDDLENGLYAKTLSTCTPEGTYIYLNTIEPCCLGGDFQKQLVDDNVYKLTGTLSSDVSKFGIETSCYEPEGGGMEGGMTNLLAENILTSDLTYFIPPTPTPPTPTPIMPFTNDISAQLVSYPSILFNDLFPLLVLIIGLPLGFWLITKLISSLKKNFK